MEVFKDNNMVIIRHKGRIITLNQRLAEYLLNGLSEIVSGRYCDHVCQACDGLTYLEVSTDEDEEIQTCQECMIESHGRYTLKDMVVRDGVYANAKVGE